MKQFFPKIFGALIIGLSAATFLMMPAISLAGDDIQVVVPKEMRTCQVDTDCTFVETRCSSCCDYVGINKKFAKEYHDQNYSESCAEYRGPVCDCIAIATKPVCVEGMCELVEDPQENSSKK